MLGTLYDTCRLIREAEQFRKSSNLQQTIMRIEGHLRKAKEFWTKANDEFNRTENTSQTRPEKYTLEMIHLNLNRAKSEREYAQKELEMILKGIKHHLEKRPSNRTNHAVGAGLSVLNVGATIVQFVATPVMLPNLARGLFIANGGLQAANVIGHSPGFYWTHEEIDKLEEAQQKMNDLEGSIKDSFKKIEYGMQKLEKIKEPIVTMADSTLVTEEENEK
ncbi:unnamed protein product [Didymodactylos carnosus]|uniref:Uncharacterized protein n=1 Tax=Didymodactylos carnosus TaxID=1234261 RepID=A0A815V8X8_9BILA|nr:unnamed protein product [Didymodactylos carnosus]CAF1531600.1 unnamed protein product [Didymodactylos carnosus]CAF4014501.1 unnamed protein product [Didymodactylos carnosus]CAF4390912.1 unnamed protein product [Didymodactylos carnosus]